MRDLSWFKEYSLENNNNISDDNLKQEINERFNRLLFQEEYTMQPIDIEFSKSPTIIMGIKPIEESIMSEHI